MTLQSVPDLQHRTVLLEEAIEALAIEGARADGIYLDGTFGRGGHSRLLLERLSPRGRLIAFDKDPQAIATAQTITDARFSIVHDSFATLSEALAERGVTQVDGVLLDLGISSPQVDEAAREKQQATMRMTGQRDATFALHGQGVTMLGRNCHPSFGIEIEC